MSYFDVVGLAAGLLQLAVACYALRLNWRFGTSRVGWLIFGAFAMLALMHGLLALNPFRLGLASSVLPEVTYALVSILLLTSIARLESSLKKHWQEKTEAQKNQSAWESEVEARVVELSRSNEELRKTVTRRQVETEEQKQIREEAERTYQALLTAAQQTEKDLLQSVTTLREELAEQKRLLVVARQTAALEADAARQEAVSGFAARQEAMTAAAAAALEHIRSLAVVAENQAQSSNARIVQAARLLQKPAHGSGTATAKSRSRRMPDSLAQLARHCAAGRSTLRREIETLKSRLEQLVGATPADQSAPATQTSDDPAAAADTGLAGQSTDFQDHLIQNVTETGTEGVSTDPETSRLEAPGPAPLEAGDRHA